MGSPTFYWYPKEGGSLEKTVMTRALSRMEADDRPQAEDSYSGAQAMTRVFYGTRRRVRLAWERLNLLSSAGAADHQIGGEEAELHQHGLGVAEGEQLLQLWDDDIVEAGDAAKNEEKRQDKGLQPRRVDMAGFGSSGRGRQAHVRFLRLRAPIASMARAWQLKP
mgnify:CR=1 FL=1